VPGPTSPPLPRRATAPPPTFLYVHVVLGDIGDYSGINEWWRRQFPDPATAPARLTIRAGALPFRAKVEFQAVAARRR
jgi:2-iminobutanoate/2-iminopropanoate deaminase